MLIWHCKAVGTIPLHWGCYGQIPVAVIGPHPEGWGLLVLHESEAGVDVKLTLEEAQQAAVERIKAALPALPRAPQETPSATPSCIRRTHEIDLLDCSHQNIPVLKSMLQSARDKGWVPLFAIGSLVYYERRVEDP